MRTFLRKLKSFPRQLHTWLCLCCAQTDVTLQRRHKVRRWSKDNWPQPEPDDLGPLKQLPKSLVLPAGYRDPFLDFIAEGGSIKNLIKTYTPDPEWNDQLMQKFRTGTREMKTDENDKIYYACTIHLSDDLKSTKRQFLSFYNIKLVQMTPEEFMKWCTDHAMPNTCLDYMDLYVVARFYGKGTKILLNLAQEQDAIRVDLSDRFYTHSGWYRAVVIVSDTRRGMHYLFNTLMGQLEPKSYRLVRSSVPEYRAPSHGDRVLKWKV